MRPFIPALAACLVAAMPVWARDGHSPLMAGMVAGAAVGELAAKAIFEDPPAWQGPPAGDGIGSAADSRAAMIGRSAAEDCAAAGAQALVKGLQVAPAAGPPAASGERTFLSLSTPGVPSLPAQESDGRPVTCRGNGLLAR